jgi:hypothetical protein
VGGVSAAYTNAVWWAMQIAADVDACESLLLGEPVDPKRLRRDWLELAAEFQLVRMDFYAIDLLHRRADLSDLLREAA